MSKNSTPPPSLEQIFSEILRKGFEGRNDFSDEKEFLSWISIETQKILDALEQRGRNNLKNDENEGLE